MIEFEDSKIQAAHKAVYRCHSILALIYWI